MKISSAWLFCGLVVICGGAVAHADFNVRDYGAVGDGKAMETEAFAKAVAACEGAGGGTVLVPPGRYLTGAIQLQSNMTLYVDSGATILGSENPKDYPLRDNPWIAKRKLLSSLIYAENAENVTITGRGTIDGQGRSWWQRLWLRTGKSITGDRAPDAGKSQDAEKKADKGTGVKSIGTNSADDANGPDAAAAKEAGLPPIPPYFQDVALSRPENIRLVKCKNVAIENLHFTNSPCWNIHPLLCEMVRVDGVSIDAPVPSPNTDGINPDACRNVQISNCRIDTGDDCITLKSGTNELGRQMGRPDEDITITNCVMYRGHGGVTIGSEMSGGVKNVTVSNCVFRGTDIGIRIKSQRGRGGVVENVTVSNVVMQDVPRPFVITTFYMGRDKPEDSVPVDEGTPRYRRFQFDNILARGAKEAGSITGLKEMPVEDILFSNVRLQAVKGFTCTCAKDIVFQDVVIDTDSGPALMLHECNDIDTARLKTNTPHDGSPLLETDVAKSQ
jgi:polygalacturonase